MKLKFNKVTSINSWVICYSLQYALLDIQNFTLEGGKKKPHVYITTLFSLWLQISVLGYSPLLMTMKVSTAKDKSNRIEYGGKTIFNKNLECLYSIFDE